MSILVLAGNKLIFSPVANRWLCFLFALETQLIIQGCFSFCWAILSESRPFLSFPPSANRLHMELDEGQRKRFPSGSVCLPKSPPCVVESCFPAEPWTLACTWEVVNELLVLLCLHVQLLPSLLNWLHLNQEIFHFYSSHSLPNLSDGELSKRLCGA